MRIEQPCVALALVAMLSVTGLSAEGHGPTSESARLELLLQAVASAPHKFILGDEACTAAECATHLQTFMTKKLSQRQVNVNGLIAGLDEHANEFKLLIEIAPERRIEVRDWLRGVAAGIDAARPAVSAEKMRELIKQLGNEDFNTRENATLELMKLGRPARELLEREQKETRDAEVKVRCGLVLGGIEERGKTALYVLEYIEASGLQFHRGRASGSWHTAKSFGEHLRTKAALQGCSLASPGKEFVEKIASSSFLNGTEYKVKLAGGETLSMREWLNKELKLGLDAALKP